MKHKHMIKGYYVPIPPTLAEVLADMGNYSADEEFDTIINGTYSSFFSFYTPVRISSAVAEDLEKFILNYFIMRRVGSGNIRKFKQIFKNRWLTIIPYYERLLETQENENNYFVDPITNAKIGTVTDATGSEDTLREQDTRFDTTRNNVHSGSFSETGNSTEINRFSDTPQGDSSDIWEITTDAQGNVHANLTDVYLTDIRGITNSYNKSGSDSSTDTMTGQDLTDLNETINKDTEHKTEVNKVGYDGVSPAELLQKYRDSFLRLYDDIAAELEQCFYNLVEVDDLIDFV